MTDDAKITAERAAPEAAQDEDGKPTPPPQKQRPKMALEQQSDFLLDLIDRCKMLDPDLRGRFAGEAILTLTTDDMLRLETIQQTLAIFDMNKAGDVMKQVIWTRSVVRPKNDEDFMRLIKRAFAWVRGGD